MAAVIFILALRHLRSKTKCFDMDEAHGGLYHNKYSCRWRNPFGAAFSVPKRDMRENSVLAGRMFPGKSRYQVMNRKIGCAVIGRGGMGSFHATHMVANPELDFIGAYDILPERTKDLPGHGRAFSSLEELLADPRIELVTIATPNDVHRPIAIQAMEAGKNVISEKPVTLSSRDLEAMLAASKRTGKIFTVHQNRRWDSDFLTMKKIFDTNQLGPVFRIESRVQGSRGIPGDWRNQKEHGGGMVYDWGIHLIDQMLMMTFPRKIVSVYAQLEYVTNENCDDGFRLDAKFDDGLIYHVEVGTSNFISLPRWYMLGEDGSAVLRDWSCKGEIVKVSDWENRDAVPIIAGVGLTKTMAPRTDDTIKTYPLKKVEGDWDDFYRNVCACIRGEAELIVTADQERRLIKFIEAVFESAEKDQVVRLDL